MALNLDWSKCEGDLGEPLGFYMMFTGIGPELTEKNAKDFYCRCKIIDKTCGYLYWIDAAPLEITPEIVKAHIGLRANVAPETFLKFATRQINSIKGDAEVEWNKSQH